MAILHRKRFGLLLRTFATKAEDVPKREAAIEKMVQKAVDAALFDRIDVVVWADQRYSDADCGNTFGALSNNSFIRRHARVHNFEKGDLFCGILNYGVATQLRDRIDHTLIASTEALDYLTEVNLAKMLEALEKGARVTGVALSELTDSVLAGRLANTMCMWDNVSLMSVGGFDLRAQKPMNERLAHFMRGMSEDGKEVFYHLAGVEEVIPLARLVDTYGPCIAPILPVSAARYQAPDPEKEPELYKRHISKMGTKFERQSALLSSVGYDLSYLFHGVMPEYRSR